MEERLKCSFGDGFHALGFDPANLEILGNAGDAEVAVPEALLAPLRIRQETLDFSQFFRKWTFLAAAGNYLFGERVITEGRHGHSELESIPPLPDAGDRRGSSAGRT